jgi:Protein of Unknown function (DUF2784)
VGYHWLVNVILALHFGFLAYLVLGGFLAWRWPRAILAHLAAVIWAILIVLEWVDCPLTWAEGWARERSGDAPLTAGFIDRYITGVIYPPEYLLQSRVAVAAMVLISWVGAYLLWRRRRARGGRLDLGRAEWSSERVGSADTRGA